MKEKHTVPKHVAIIPDGNRRWAKQQGLSVYEGHSKGVESFRTILKHAVDQGVYAVSTWGMSVDNLTRRSPREIRDLLRIFYDQFTAMVTDEELHSRNIRIRVLGRWREKFPTKVRRAIEKAEDVTKDYTNYACNFLLAYNGTDEMMQAIQQIVNDSERKGRVKITPSLIKRHLFTKDLPPVDLVIRTGGEPHLSAGFMMWDIADAQFHFTDIYWPAFTPADFDLALADFASRERRLGK